MPRNKPGFSLSQLGIEIDGPTGNIRPSPEAAASTASSAAGGGGNGAQMMRLSSAPAARHQGEERGVAGIEGAKRGIGVGATAAAAAAATTSNGNSNNSAAGQSPFIAFSEYVDPTGNLSFEGKAVISANGVDFSSGKSYKISMAQMQVLGELGRGQYGVVHKVFHRPTRVTMALKEIRLELNRRALQQIIMELDVLHKARSPYIVDFYGAFFVESCVYYSMEYMDFGSLDRLYADGIPEPELANIALAVVKGLTFLKSELNIIHRDVKPTNILVNRRGEVKLCDFGVSGELKQSLAKTHVGCQSYMAPERIFGPAAGPDGYTVQSDVWSLGITIVEAATGHFPFDGASFASVFEQLNAIVNCDPPRLSPDSHSPDACDFIARCLAKDAASRPTYQMLLDHPWLQRAESASDVDMEDWARRAHALYLSRTASN
ncbi:MAP kinase kinase Wis1 [Coemansia sp. RSA 2049]|nr:MAP kinase kinase Wis1 [Coemansia sp. RSA 2049]